MSLLLDALKKSEAQRRRGTSPAIDLTRTPLSGSPRRSVPRWLSVLLAGVLLVAAAPWLWPHVSDLLEKSQDGAVAGSALVEATNSASPNTGPEGVSGREVQAEASAEQPAPAPVAGASSRRRIGAEMSADAVSVPASRTGPVADRAAGDSENAARPNPATTDAAPDAGSSMQEPRRREQARQQPTGSSGPSEPPPEPSPQVNQPSANFIRPWELPQAQRAEFPKLVLTVHFYAERSVDRFVLINGQRYREGEHIGPRIRLVEILQRGAVVEFGSYRVLIE